MNRKQPKVKKFHCLSIGLINYSQIDGLVNLSSAAFDSRQIANKFRSQGFETTHIENPNQEELNLVLEQFRSKVLSRQKKTYVLVYVQGISRFVGDPNIEATFHLDEVRPTDFEILLPDETYVNITDSIQILEQNCQLEVLYFQDCASLDTFSYGKARRYYNKTTKVMSNVTYFISQSNVHSGGFLVDGNHAWCTLTFMINDIMALKFINDPKNFQEYLKMKQMEQKLLQHMPSARSSYGFELETQIIQYWFKSLKDFINSKPVKKEISLEDFINTNQLSNQLLKLNEYRLISGIEGFNIFEIPAQQLLRTFYKAVVVDKDQKTPPPPEIIPKSQLILLYSSNYFILYDVVKGLEVSSLAIDAKDGRKVMKVFMTSYNEVYVLTNKNLLIMLKNFYKSQSLVVNGECSFDNIHKDIKITDIKPYNTNYYVVALNNGYIQLYKEHYRGILGNMKFELLYQYQCFLDPVNISSITVQYVIETAEKSKQYQQNNSNQEKLQIFIAVDRKKVIKDDSQQKDDYVEFDLAPQLAHKLTIMRSTAIILEGYRKNKHFQQDDKPYVFSIISKNTEESFKHIFEVGNSKMFLDSNGGTRVYSSESVNQKFAQTTINPLNPSISFLGKLMKQSKNNKDAFVSTHNNQITLRLDANKRFTLFSNYFTEFEFQGGITWTQNDQILVLATKENEGTFFAVFDIDLELKQYLSKLP
eukprot:403340502